MTEPSASEIARALSGMRRREQKNCARCGKEFVGIAKARCCSHACTVALYRQEHRDEINVTRRRRYHEEKAGLE